MYNLSLNRTCAKSRAGRLAPLLGLQDMSAIRIILQVVLGLFSAAIVLCFSDNDAVSSLIMLSVFVFFILVLGPLWPSQENISRWSEKSAFRLPTDNQQVAIYVLNYLCAAFGLYKAWDTYANPTKELWRHEKTAYSIAGIKGVIAFWLLLAVACLVYGMIAHEKSKKA